MRKLLLVLAPAALLALFSCDKENRKEVLAGKYDDDFIFQEFNPPREISVSWDGQNLYGHGTDSLDVDLDGVSDLVFSLDVLNYDSIHLLTGYPSPFPNCIISLKSEMEVAFCTEHFYIGLGQTSTARFADTLNPDERIDRLSDWYSGTQAPIAMWQQNPGSGMTPSFGSWYYAHSIKYIAIRKENERLGWIEVDAADPRKLRFIRFALEK